MTIDKLLKKTNNISSLDREVILSFVLKKLKEFLFTHPEYILNKRQEKKYQELIEKRREGEPVAYITNNKEFYRLDFYINKTVLIPRPETEILIEEVIQDNKNKKVVIADVGTGSGCIAVTLSKLLPKAKIYATDICKRALKIAAKNAQNHGIKIDFTQGSLLEPLEGKKIDVLVANLPYGWEEWKNDSSAETIGLKFEPKKALFTKENGLYLYHKLFLEIKERKQKPQLIYCEFDPRQTKDFKKLAKEYLPEYGVKIKKDLAGRDRVLILKFKK